MAACSRCCVESVLKRFSSSVFDLSKVKRLHVCASRRFNKIRANSDVFLAAARAHSQPCIVLVSMHMGQCYLGLRMERCAEPSTILAASRTVSAPSMRSSVPSEAFSAVWGLKGGQDYGEYSARDQIWQQVQKGKRWPCCPRYTSFDDCKHQQWLLVVFGTQFVSLD